MEERLSGPEIKLLDKVYNLRGPDSLLIASLKREQETISNGKTDKEGKKETLQNEIYTLEAEKANLLDQRDKFIEDFQKFKREDYSVVLEKLGIKFDPQEMVSIIKEKAPDEISSMEDTLGSKKAELNNITEQIKEDVVALEQIEQRLSDSQAIQERLNTMIEEALAGNENITKLQVKNLFLALDFSEKDINEIGTILIFGTEKLKNYDEMFKAQRDRTETPGKKIDELMSEAQDGARKQIEQQDISKVDNSEEKQVSGITELLHEEKTTKEVNTPSEPTNIIDQLGIDTTELTKEEIDLLINIDPIILTNNLRVINELGCNIKEAIKAITDLELAEKVNTLSSYNKKPHDIRNSLDIITGISLNDLKVAITKLDTAGLNISNLPLLVLENVDNYINNIKELNAHSITPDAKELASHSASIEALDNKLYKSNLDLASLYGVNLKKPNGKIAFEGLAQSPKDFVGKMDEYIEAGESDILKFGAEYLAKDADSVISAVELLKNYSVEYKTADKYKPVLSSPTQIETLVGSDISNTLPTQEKNNTNLKELLASDTCINNILTGQEKQEYYIMPQDDEIASTLTKIVENVADTTKEKVYTIAGVMFSVIKFKRNLGWLLKNNVNVSNKEIIMASLATNSNKTEEDLKKVVEALGFNLAMGGI